MLDNNKLHFNNVRYQKESGVYQCVAENKHGMIVSSTWVDILGKHSSNLLVQRESNAKERDRVLAELCEFHKSSKEVCFPRSSQTFRMTSSELTETYQHGTA